MATGTAIEVVMPQMGVSVSEGTVTKWLKQVGEPIEADETLLEISTDKVDTEVPAPGSGVVTEILVSEGETVEVGTILARIAAAAAAPAAAPAAPTPAPPAALPESVTAEAAPAAPPPVEATVETTVEAAAEAPVEAPSESTFEDTVEAAPTAAPVGSPNGRAFVSPVVARIAGEHGIDPARVHGTGIGGRVTKKDILAFIESGAGAAEPPRVEAPVFEAQPVEAQPVEAQPVEAPPVVAPPVEGPTPEPVAEVAPAVAEVAAVEAPPVEARPVEVPPVEAPAVEAPVEAVVEAPAPAPVAPPAAPAPRAPTPTAAAEEPEAGESFEPMSAMRRGIAQHMRHSLDTSAHVTSAIEVDMTKVVTIRERLKKEYQSAYGVNPTYLAFIARATVETLRDHPYVNGEIRGDRIVTRNFVNLGFAVELAEGKGLIVPVVKNAETLNLLGMAKAIADVAARARSKQLTPDDVTGGSFTITNPGGYGTFHGTPIISQPQVGILGTYAIVKRPWVITDESGADAIAIRSLMNLTLTYDHRLVDGAYAGRFLRDLRQRLQTWGENDY